MVVKELGHLVLYVRDLERSRRFYRDVLGWREIGSVAEWAVAFSSGRTHHELLLIQTSPDAAPIPREPRVGLYHFGLKVGENKLRLELKAQLTEGSTTSSDSDFLEVVVNLVDK